MIGAAMKGTAASHRRLALPPHTAFSHHHLARPSWHRRLASQVSAAGGTQRQLRGALRKALLASADRLPSTLCL